MCGHRQICPQNAPNEGEPVIAVRRGNGRVINIRDLPDCRMINVYGRHRVLLLAVPLHPQLIKVYGVCLCGPGRSAHCKRRRQPIHALPVSMKWHVLEGRWANLEREGSGRDTEGDL